MSSKPRLLRTAKALYKSCQTLHRAHLSTCIFTMLHASLLHQSASYSALHSLSAHAILRMFPISRQQACCNCSRLTRTQAGSDTRQTLVHLQRLPCQSLCPGARAAALPFRDTGTGGAGTPWEQGRHGSRDAMGAAACERPGAEEQVQMADSTDQKRVRYTSNPV